MKRFEEYRTDRAAIKAAHEYNKVKRAGKSTPVFCPPEALSRCRKTMEEIASSDGVSCKVMARRYLMFFAPVIDPEHERARGEYLRARKQALRPRETNERKRPVRLNGADHSNV